MQFWKSILSLKATVSSQSWWATDCLSAHICRFMQKCMKSEAVTQCRLQTPCSVWVHLYIWPLSEYVWELSERRQTAYRWIHSFQGLLYLAQMFDCYSACLCNLASHLKGSSRNDNKTNIHHICLWLMSCSHQGQSLPPLMFVHTFEGKFHLRERKAPSQSVKLRLYHAGHFWMYLKPVFYSRSFITPIGAKSKGTMCFYIS